MDLNLGGGLGLPVLVGGKLPQTEPPDNPGIDSPAGMGMVPRGRPSGRDTEPLNTTEK